MAKGKKGKALVLGGLLGLGLWILWQLGLALLAVKEVLPEDAMGLGSGAAGLLPLSGKCRKKGGGRRCKRLVSAFLTKL